MRHSRPMSRLLCGGGEVGRYAVVIVGDSDRRRPGLSSLPSPPPCWIAYAGAVIGRAVYVRRSLLGFQQPTGGAL